jgi:hypothetical protein
MHLRRIDAERFAQHAKSGAASFVADAEPELYWLVSNAAGGCDVVFAHADYYLEPEAAEACEGYVVGANGWLFCAARGAVVWQLPLPSRFYSILRVDGNELLIHHEIGFMKVRCDGEVRLNVVTGLISSYRIDGDVLEYETLEGKPGRIQITGRTA